MRQVRYIEPLDMSIFTIIGIGAPAGAVVNLAAAWKPKLSLDALRTRIGIRTTRWTRRTSLVVGTYLLSNGRLFLFLGRG
jgi:hypothetical protein